MVKVNCGTLPAGWIESELNRAAAEAYLEGPIFAQLRQHPGIKDLTARQFDIQKSPTKVTRGPLDATQKRPAMAATGV